MKMTYNTLKRVSMDKRFIEESFPVKEVSEISAKEKNIRDGNISTLHIWWARRPLASSRATNYAALIPAPKNDLEWVKKRNFIIDLSKMENSLDQKIINKAKQDILEANGGKPPKVLDPFSGGGSIPLEALRLGCESYANDYNPVAVLIEKCTLEYPQKYGQSKEGKWSENSNPLVEDVKKWGNWVLKEAKKEIGHFYPKEPDGSIPIGYIWAKTLNCQNPNCDTEIPLMRQFWLSKKKNKKIALKPYKNDKGKLSFKIVGQKKSIPKDFDPSNGTISKSIVKCPICGSIIEADLTRRLFNEGKSGEKLLAIVSIDPKKKGRKYRLTNEKDLLTYTESEKYLNNKIGKFQSEWGIDPIPNEPLPPQGTLGFRIQKYGTLKWGELFNDRQKLTLVTFIEKIRQLKDLIEDKEYRTVIMSYLNLTLNRMAMSYNKFTQWQASYEKMGNMFSRQALPMVWDYAEPNPFSGSVRSWKSLFKDTINVISSMSKSSSKSCSITQSSATNLPFPENYFDAIFTDPPYYDNVPYSYLSDFFYVWMKRTIGDLYPKLFLTPLTPKSEEIVAYTHEKSWDEAKNFFESMLKKSFQEINRLLKPNGIATIVYAHKTTEGWETLINSLLDSGLIVTASWPISTERATRMRAQSSAALASSIYIIVRKLEKKDMGWYKDVKQEIKDYVPQKLDKLWQEGISGADFFIAAIGSSIEIFGKYKKILDNEGNEIRADKLLTFVRGVVTDYAMHQILHNSTAAELSPLSKFYLLWRWNYHELSVPFDEARKLAQSTGIDLTNEWNKGFIKKRGDKITVQGPDKRDPKTLKEPKELIDVLHKVCLLWKAGKTTEMKQTLQESGYATNDAFYKVAQAISETLPNSSSEKKLIEGFLTGKDTLIQENIENKNTQTKLM